MNMWMSEWMPEVQGPKPVPHFLNCIAHRPNIIYSFTRKETA